MLSARNTLTHVWNTPDKSLVPVEQLIPSDPAKAQALRRSLVEAYQAYKRDPQSSDTLWRCPICWEPLLMAGRPNGQGFYIHHRKNPDFLCPFKNGSSLSLDQWNALRFNGQKESHRHIQIKEQIRSMLEKWPGATSVQVEPTIRGTDKLSFKRPDVLARIGGQEVAIEIQLSSTYIDVIADRERFYRENETVVLWVFDHFSHEGHRLYEKDIYYQHNCNAFELNEAALEATRDTGVPHITCHYLAPHLRGDNRIDNTWHTTVVPFSDITFCTDTYRAYWYDHDAELAELKRKLELQKPLMRIRELIGIDRFAEDRMKELQGLLDEVYLRAGVEFPAPPLTVGPIRMMEVIVSAQEGHFVGEMGAGQNSNWPFWANTIFEYYGEFAKAFLKVTRHYGFSSEFVNRRTWQRKKEAIAAKRIQGEQSEQTDWWPLFALLAPECNWQI